MNDDLFEFIKLKTPSLEKIIEYSLKDTDDEDGYIGEHYIVKCLLISPSYTSTIPIDTLVERTCLVDRDEFRRWKRKEDSIRWIN